MIDWAKKVQTRDGRAVRILCTDGPPIHPVIGILDEDNGHGIMRATIHRWTSSGYSMLEIDSYGIINVPTKREGWVKMYDLDQCHPSISTAVFKTEEDAKSAYARSNPNSKIVHITWED